MAATAYCKTEVTHSVRFRVYGHGEGENPAPLPRGGGENPAPLPLDPVKTIGFSPWQPPHTVKQKVKWTSWVPEGHLTL